jgi:hypothetical protein
MRNKRERSVNEVLLRCPVDRSTVQVYKKPVRERRVMVYEGKIETKSNRPEHHNAEMVFDPTDPVIDMSLFDRKDLD